MATQKSVEEVRERFGEVLSLVHDRQVPVEIEKDGETWAVIVTAEQWANYLRLTKEHFFEIVDNIQFRNKDKDPEEVYRDVTAAVEEVRQERYEREQRESSRRS